MKPHSVTMAYWLFTAALLASPLVNAQNNIGAASASKRTGEFQGSLRAGAEPTPDKKEWENGAAVAYTSIDNKSTTDIDAEASLDYISWIPLSRGRDADFTKGSIRWKGSVGAYLHKFRAAEAPSHDRGGLISLGASLIPRSDASGPVVNFDAALLIKAGKTLTETGTDTGVFVDVDKERYVLTASAYYEPTTLTYGRLTFGAYADKTSNSPTAALNGRESGSLAKLQISGYPLGREVSLGTLRFTPLLTLVTQKQWDASASGMRQKRDYRLSSATLSILLAPPTSTLVPSLDISRSIGADLLEGRERSGKTSVRLALKF